MGQRQASKDSGTSAREVDEHAAAVGGCAGSRDVAVRFQAIDEFHGGVMLELHAQGELADGRVDSFGQTSNSQKKLMLLRLQAVFASLFLAEVEKTPDFLPELRQGAVFSQRDIHVFISYHDILDAEWEPDDGTFGESRTGVGRLIGNPDILDERLSYEGTEGEPPTA